MTDFSKITRGKHIGGAMLSAALLAAAPLNAATEIPEGSTLADVQARQKINQEQAQFARNQLAQNAANQAEYERKLSEVNAAIAKISADDAAARAAYEAEKARLTAQHAAAMAKWEADVAACKGGDWSRCATTG